MPSPMPKHLLIVESPAKARTINKYLGKDFQVLASYGHVRDLVPKEGAVDPDDGFRMRYELIDKNEKHVEAIAKAAKAADGIWLATDPDREGEAISWHIAEILRERGLLDGKQLRRVVFTEITPRAIREASSLQPYDPPHGWDGFSPWEEFDICSPNACAGSAIGSPDRHEKAAPIARGGLNIRFSSDRRVWLHRYALRRRLTNPTSPTRPLASTIMLPGSGVTNEKR